VKETKVGKIKNIKYDTKTNDLEISIIITDAKFKKKLLRDLSLAGNIEFKNDLLFYKEKPET
jgi:predicted nicotinamide N-methyase